MALNYKCPNCGGPMEFDPTSGMIVCSYCDTRLDAKAADANNELHEYKTEEEEKVEMYNEDNMDIHGYRCPNCGATIMTDDVTAATFCSYCGNPTLIEGRLSKERKPEMVLPFEYTKEQAKQEFKKWCGLGVLTPSGFTSQATLEKITGIYVPFWLYECMANCRMEAKAEIRTSHRSGDDEIIETQHFLVRRNVLTHYVRIPADASEKMDDATMDKLEPFDYSKMKPFAMPYLSGYYAEKYTYTDKDMRDRVGKRMDEYVRTATRETINGYTSVTPVSTNVSFRWDKAEYVMLPVWMLNYKYGGKTYTWIMNGQSGRIVGQKPVSGAKSLMWFGIFYVIFLIITLIIGGCGLL